MRLPRFAIFGRPAPGRSILAGVLLAFVSSAHSVPASAQFRLHSDSEETLTAQLVKDLESARASHLAILDDHRAYVASAIATERTLIVQRELAERDAFVALVLKAKPADRGELLRKQIDSEWTEVTGLSPGAINDRIGVAAHHASSLEIEQAGLRRDRASLIAAFEAKGGKGSYCDRDGGGSVTFSAGAELREASAIVDTCGELDDIRDRIGRNYGLAGGAASVLDADATGAGGLLRDAQRDAAGAAALAKAQEVLIKTVKAQVKALDDYYQCELARVSVAEAIRADAAAVQGALDTLAAGDSRTVFNADTFRAAWTVIATQPVDPDCTKAAPPVQQPAAAQPTADRVLSAIGALDRFGASDALLAQLRESALDVQGSALGEALQCLAVPSGTAAECTRNGERAAAALRIFANLEQLYRARTGRLPDVGGVLVALADVRMRQATAKIEADRLAELVQLAKQRETALRRRAMLLAEARSSLADGSESALMASLRRYAESWNRGAIPATVLSVSMFRGRYLPWIDRERAVVDASYAMLAPAVAQLEAYGKGGIKPDTIAQFLQALGLGGIALK